MTDVSTRMSRNHYSDYSATSMHHLSVCITCTTNHEAFLSRIKRDLQGPREQSHSQCMLCAGKRDVPVYSSSDSSWKNQKSQLSAFDQWLSQQCQLFEFFQKLCISKYFTGLLGFFRLLDFFVLRILRAFFVFLFLKS